MGAGSAWGNQVGGEPFLQPWNRKHLAAMRGKVLDIGHIESEVS